MDGIPPLLEELLLAPGPSGFEDAVHTIVRREAAGFGAEVTGDVLGSTSARVRGTGAGRTLALFAHADQIGMIVRGADGPGLLTVAKLGGWRPAAAVGQRVRVLTRDGEVRGVVVGPRDGEPDWQSLRVDVGAEGREDALRFVRPGDPIVLHGPPELLPGGRILSAALDDRAGIYAALEALRRLASAPVAWDVVLVVSTQEETGTHGGARAAAEALAPEVAVVVEVTYDADVPGPEPWGDVRLGGGPTIFRGAVVSPLVGDRLLEIAEQERIDVALESGQETLSDADDIFTTGAGVPCAIICIPLRYMHSAGEIVQLSDVDEASRLVEAYARSLATTNRSCADSRWRAPRLRAAGTCLCDPLRHRLRCPHPVRQARRRPRRHARDGARLDRRLCRARARRGRIRRRRLRRHRAGAPGGGGAGAGPTGRDRGGDSEEVPADTINKVCASSIRAIEIADLMVRAGRPRRRRHGRDGVDVERAVPPSQGAVRVPARERRGSRPHGLRRAHVDLRRRPHGRAGLAGGTRARDLPRGPGRVGGPVACARGRGRGRRPSRRGDRPGRQARRATSRSGATRRSRSSPR